MAVKGVIVGAGRAGTHLHFGALKAAGADVLGFVEGNPDLLKSTTERFGLKHGFSSIEEAFAQVGPFDFVDICSSTKSHFPLARVALERGCHVSVEKPITETAEELEALRELRNRSDRSVCAIHNHKFYPGIEELRRRVKGGEAGTPLYIHREMSFVHSRVRMMDPDHWAHNLPGGRLFEANPHNLYLLYGLVGEMELVEILPRKVSERWPHARIDEFTATLRNAKTTATIHMSLNGDAVEGLAHAANFILVVGSKKSLYADYRQVIDVTTKDVRFPGARPFLRRAKERLFHSSPTDHHGGVINDGKGSGHYWMLERFVGFMEGRYEKEPVPFDEAYYVQRMNLEMGHRVENLLTP